MDCRRRSVASMEVNAALGADAMTKDDIELAFIRQFSVHGIQLGGAMSQADRKERIRIAIMREQFQDRLFPDARMTYGEAFRFVYGEPCEKRQGPRLDPATEEAFKKVMSDLDDDDLDDDEHVAAE